jgi:hypothetical protein
LNQVYELLSQSGKTPDQLQEELKKFETGGITIAVSKEFAAKTQELSDLHKSSLENLETGAYGKPSIQAKDKKPIARIFYLAERSDVTAPSFEEMSSHLRNQLTQQAVVGESQNYIGKLRKHYGFEPENAIPEDLHPFSLQ